VFWLPENFHPWRRVCGRHADILASRPISSLMAVKHTMVEPIRPEIAAATARENAHFAELMGGQANAAALADFGNRRR